MDPKERQSFKEERVIQVSKAPKNQLRKGLIYFRFNDKENVTDTGRSIFGGMVRRSQPQLIRGVNIK